MDLTVDIGNTAAKAVAFREGRPVEELRTDNHTLAGLRKAAREWGVERCIVGSVIPLTEEAQAELDTLGCPVVHATQDVLRRWHRRLGTPATLGTDRMAAVIAATARHPKADLLIIDIGTCVTYELIERGQYQGGSIAPGLRLRLQAMHEHTALLPLVDHNGDCPSIGYDTTTALRCGAVNGLRYEIEGYIRHFRQANPALKVFLTGGNSLDLYWGADPDIITDPYLVPEGLEHILCNLGNT